MRGAGRREEGGVEKLASRGAELASTEGVRGSSSVHTGLCTRRSKSDSRARALPSENTQSAGT